MDATADLPPLLARGEILCGHNYEVGQVAEVPLAGVKTDQMEFLFSTPWRVG